MLYLYVAEMLLLLNDPHNLHNGIVLRSNIIKKDKTS